MEERIPGGTEGNELEVYRLQKEEISWIWKKKIDLGPVYLRPITMDDTNGSWDGGIRKTG